MHRQATGFQIVATCVASCTVLHVCVPKTATASAQDVPVGHSVSEVREVIGREAEDVRHYIAASATFVIAHCPLYRHARQYVSDDRGFRLSFGSFVPFFRLPHSRSLTRPAV